MPKIPKMTREQIDKEMQKRGMKPKGYGGVTPDQTKTTRIEAPEAKSDIENNYEDDPNNFTGRDVFAENRKMYEKARDKKK